MADFAPDTEAGIAEVVRAARARAEPLLVHGRGSKLGMLRPVQAAGSLSTRNHAGIGLYAPNELILSARAGTALSEVEAALAEGGQHLIAEPPDLGALLLGVLNNGLNMVGVNPYVQTVVKGGIILLAIYIGRERRT